MPCSGSKAEQGVARSASVRRLASCHSQSKCHPEKRGRYVKEQRPRNRGCNTVHKYNYLANEAREKVAEEQAIRSQETGFAASPPPRARFSAGCQQEID